MINLKINLANMPAHVFISIPAAIVVFITWLIYRLKRDTRLAIVNQIYNEIYKHFHAVKKDMGGFEHRMEYLNNLTQDIEHKLNELENKMNNIQTMYGDAK